MTVQELIDELNKITDATLTYGAKERDLLDKQIAKHFNFNIEDVESVCYLTKEQLKSDTGKIVVD